jgi:hypothetical protein
LKEINLEPRALEQNGRGYNLRNKLDMRWSMGKDKKVLELQITRRRRRTKRNRKIKI